MITADSLRTQTCKDLAQLAKKHKVDGWHSMRKEQLVMAILRVVQKKASSKNGSSAVKKRRAISNGGARSKPEAKQTASRIQKQRQSSLPSKDLATGDSSRPEGEAKKDRLVVMVRDSYWLHACWELRRQGVERAAAALRQHWHTAQPVIRLLSVAADDTTNVSERVLRDIPIHGGVNNWYIDVSDPPSTYRLDIGYLAQNGEYYSLARSNRVTTPPAGSCDSLDENWRDVAANFDNVYAMSGGYDKETAAGDLQELFEERLRRPMGSSAVTRFGISTEKMHESQASLHFEVDAEMIVYGVATPGSHVTMKGQPVELRKDGSFTLRVALPEGRQVVPVVTNNANGTEQQTIVIALERNTKKLETLIREPQAPNPE